MPLLYTRDMTNGTPQARAGHLREVDRRLSEAYGEPEWSGGLRAINELVLTILSQHTSDSNSGAAYDRLVASFGGDWHAVMDAPTSEVAAAIRSAGLANVKAPRIQAVLREVVARTGGLDLQFLQSLPPHDARRWLTELPGVGPKTASCVLLFSLGVPLMPVDTHVHRVGRRLGLIPAHTSAEAAHDLFLELVPSDRMYPFHINLIRHGRNTCGARVPHCGACVLKDACAYYWTAEANDRVAPRRQGWS